MKRLTILCLFIAVFSVICFGQRRARFTRQIIQLTEPEANSALKFEEALAKQQIVRRFTGQSLNRNLIGQLAWAGQGIIDQARGLRTALSEASAYPVELIFATDDGTFVYRPTDHSIEQTSNQDIRSPLEINVSRQEPITGAGCSIILAGNTSALASRLGGKARTNLSIEVGRIAQNIQLQAVCLNLGSVAVGDFDTREVGKICGLNRGTDALYLIFVGYPAGQETGETKSEQTTNAGKKAALIIASGNFQEDELFQTKRVLDAAQIETVIVAPRTGIIRGVAGIPAEAGILIDQLNVDDFDAIIFVTGAGTIEYAGKPLIANIITETVRKGKVLGAIGVAPSLLANAGVLNGVRATSFLSERAILIQAGAIYTGAPVERERYIITATGPQAATQFGRAIADALTVR
jgi:protease I